MSLYNIVLVEDFPTILALIQGGCEVEFESLKHIVRCHNQRLSDNDHYELLKEILKRKDCPALSI